MNEHVFVECGDPTLPCASATMTWHEYRRHFTITAKRAGRSAKYISLCLAYAKRLHDRRFPIIYDLDHLSNLVGYSTPYLLGCAYSPERFYRRYSVPKCSGGERIIDEPLPSLKEVQRWVLDRILYTEPVSKYAKGFVRGEGVKRNAAFHRHQPAVLSVDIKNFFPSIKRHRVYGLFRAFGYSQGVANILARLSTRDDSLPQGAPTSPAISNLIASSIDRRLGVFARNLSLRYTRYADDLAFSGNFRAGSVVSMARRVFADEGFTLNDAKTRLMQSHQRQEVTGVVVNERLRAPRTLRRKLRQAIHYIETYGLDSHLEVTGEIRSRHVYHWMGIATFILHLDPADFDANHAMVVLRHLLPIAREIGE